MSPPPIISICLPTWNRASLLEVCLATIGPQLKAVAPKVELLVGDNASDDRTPTVVSEYKQNSQVRYIRNESNIGGWPNAVNLIRHAQGDFIWLLGDDDTLNANALKKILHFLEHGDALLLDLIAFNVAYFPQEQRPIAHEARGGITLESEKLLRRIRENAVVLFDDLLEGPFADFTAMYSFMLRRSLWLKHLEAFVPEREPMASVQHTYPHACIVASAMPGRQVGAIFDPVITVFEQHPTEFGWARYFPITVLLRLSELLNLFERNGVSRHRLLPYRKMQVLHSRRWMSYLIWDVQTVGSWYTALRFILATPGQRFPLSQMFVRSLLLGSDEPTRLGRLLKVTDDIYRPIHQYLFHNCRPARWLRAKNQPDEV